ncbi:aspartate 1-decarboxylase [Clostridia bacterium]|nr:aspartate 1-decarboxylase [Clostridia bacterium]
MLREMMIGKIHRGVITEANIHYMGSITLDPDMMEKSNILENQKVQVVDINNGKRFETYAITGKRGSRTICINGAAARLVTPGDRIIIISYGLISEKELKEYEPKILLLNEKNESILGEI